MTPREICVPPRILQLTLTEHICSFTTRERRQANPVCGHAIGIPTQTSPRMLFWRQTSTHISVQWMTVPVEKTGSSSVKGSLKISSIYTSNLGSSDTAASQTGLYNAYSSLNSSISTVRNKFTSGTWTPSIDGKSGTG